MSLSDDTIEPTHAPRPPRPPRADALSWKDEREAVLLGRAALGGPVYERAAAIAAAASRDWRHAPAAVARGLRDAAVLASVERRLVGEAVHGWIRMHRRLCWLARTEAVGPTLQVWFAEALAEHEAASPAALAEMRAALARAGLDAERVARGDELIAAEVADPVARLGVALSYPDWMVERVLAAWGPEAGTALLQAMNRRAPLVVRANRVRGDRDALAARLQELGIESTPTRLAPDGLVLHTHVNVYSLAPFRDGSMEVQDEGSQLVAEVVAPPPRSVVIDACAGAGGKTLALGATLAGHGRVIALDVAQHRLTELRQRVRRAGLTNVEVHRVPPEGPPEGMLRGSVRRPKGGQKGGQKEGQKDGPKGDGGRWEGAERVLVDAPCSGLGVVRRNPETKWRLGPGDVTELCAKQARILESYAPFVRVGGRLVYATCSVLPEENDAVMDAFLQGHGNFEAVPVKEILGRERALTMGDGERVRLAPHVHDTDGFFAAVVRRRS
ncbi:MAG TPA: SAM-dependent methyltransferase [Polyangia bacterium]|nr:SAM-dependent methyltransferase [Polyangia bacterium]